MEEKLIYVVMYEGTLIGVFDDEKLMREFIEKNEEVKDLEVEVSEIILNQPYHGPYDWKEKFGIEEF